jgi:putrescine transport system substrate-binding protein
MTILCLFGCIARADEPPVLNIYNWADYIGSNTVAEFERRTGIKVTYATFDSDEALEAKIMAGGGGYDLVTTSTSYFGPQIKAGFFQTLDKSKLPNWKNLDPRYLKAEEPYDPGNAHAMPYMHSTNGFIYNVDMIKARMPDAPVDSLDMIFKPEIAAKFADCGISILDNPEDVIQLALNYLHLDPNTHNFEDFKKVEALIASVKPYIRTFDSQGYLTTLPNRELCIAMAWSGDYATARDRAKAAGSPVNLAYTIPKEGANGSFDAFLIPKNAPHPENAHKFLNFLLEPKVIAAITNEIHYGNDNLAANAFVEPAILADPAIYPTDEVMKRLYQSYEVPANVERFRTRTWTRIKTGH